MAAYLNRPGAPKKKRLVACEWTGALVAHLGGKADAAEWETVSVDLRVPEHRGPSYQGDVRDVIDLVMWDEVYFIGPNCFQHLRKDKCLSYKIEDGRAFWGGAMVLWCICCPHAKALVVEQPDTICFDYIDWESMPGVTVVEVRSHALGDAQDKQIKLVLRNFEPGQLGADPIASPTKLKRPPHWSYATAEERDRARSSWIPLQGACRYIANLRVANAEGAAPLDYVEHIREFGSRWRGPLPTDYDNPTGQPLSQEARRYQQVRGHGDGRKANCAQRTLTYWHCLDDEQWQPEGMEIE
jgi:hypothetical protein